MVQPVAKRKPEQSWEDDLQPQNADLAEVARHGGYLLSLALAFSAQLNGIRQGLARRGCRLGGLRGGCWRRWLGRWR